VGSGLARYAGTTADSTGGKGSLGLGHEQGAEYEADGRDDWEAHELARADQHRAGQGSAADPDLEGDHVDRRRGGRFGGCHAQDSGLRADRYGGEGHTHNVSSDVYSVKIKTFEREPDLGRWDCDCAAGLQ
jgi:hypothetical protein